jgi:flavin-dependent dehydrogenase
VAQWLPFDLEPAISARAKRLRFTWELKDPVEGELGTREALWMVRREVFDALLASKAKEQGAELREDTEARSARFEAGLWIVDTTYGPVQGRYLIAGDGALGRMGPFLEISRRGRTLAGALEAEPRCTMEDTSTIHMDFGFLPKGYVWAFPKADGWSVGLGVFRGKSKSNPRKLLGAYAQAFGLASEGLAPIGHPIPLWDGERRLHGQQALLVGDAACLADPFTAEGIRPAVLSGLRAADAIHAALGGDEGALEAYTRRMHMEWGAQMVWARRLARLFYGMPALAYRLGVKHPRSIPRMGQLLCGEVRYSDVARKAIDVLSSLRS